MLRGALLAWMLKLSDLSFSDYILEPNQRPAGRLTDPSLYPFVSDVATRFQDLDLLGHINNVAMTGMFEEARYIFGQQAGFSECLSPGSRIMVASVQVHFLSEAFHGDPVRFYIGVGYLGSSSWRLRALGRQGDKAVMIGDASIVHATSSGPAPLPSGLRTILEGLRMRIGEGA